MPFRHDAFVDANGFSTPRPDPKVDPVHGVTLVTKTLTRHKPL